MKRYSHQQIEALLDKFMDGQTTVEEEALLADYFRSADVPAKWEDYRVMFDYFDSGMEGDLAPVEQPRPTLTRLMGRRWWGIAAAACITAAIVATVALHDPTTTVVPETPSIATNETTPIGETQDVASLHETEPSLETSITRPVETQNLASQARPIRSTRQARSTRRLQAENAKLAQENARLQRELADLKRRAFIIDLEAMGYRAVQDEDGSIVLIDLEQELENELNNEDNSILERLSAVAQRLENAEKNLSEVEGMSARVRSAIIDLKDISQSTGAIVDTLNDDPAELARVDDRLNNIYSLERKHNAQDVNHLIAIQQDYERQLGEIEHNDDIIEGLKELVNTHRTTALDIASRLSERRHDAANRFGKDLLALAAPLGMKNIAFSVDFTTTDLTPSGTDSVEFMMSFNKNQRPMPVKDTASGGEISRVMLCIKTITARHMRLPSIIFDEVDTGVSGDVANMIGEMMAGIASTIQVIAITHLPQVAANGDHHLRVFKTDTDVETLTQVETLDEHEHIMEIARMLSGKGLNQAAIENAKSLIKHNIKRK